MPRPTSAATRAIAELQLERACRPFAAGAFFCKRDVLYCNMVGSYFSQLRQILKGARSDAQLFQAIADAPFHDAVKATQLDLGIVVFLQVNPTSKTIDRVALSNTEAAVGAVRMSEKPFHEIKIPLGHQKNAIARAIATGAPQFVSDWKYLFIPAMDARAARFNQAGAGIEFSVVFPYKARDGGALIFSYFQIDKNICHEHHEFMQNYIALVDTHLALKHSDAPAANRKHLAKGDMAVDTAA